MAKTSLKVKQQRKPKYSTRAYTRCRICGRPHSVLKKYGPENERVISGIKKISKPGLKVYAKATDVPRVLGGLGIAIISTSNGVISDKEARKLGVGGEVICYVW